MTRPAWRASEGSRAPMSGWRAEGIENGSPSIRPAEVIGSWATTQPPGRTARGHPGQHHGRIDHVQEQEPAEGQVDRLGQPEVLAGLGDGQHLAVGRRAPRPPRRGPSGRCRPRRPGRRGRRSRPGPPPRRPRRRRRRRRSIRARSPGGRGRWPAAAGRRRRADPGAPSRQATHRHRLSSHCDSCPAATRFRNVDHESRYPHVR